MPPLALDLAAPGARLPPPPRHPLGRDGDGRPAAGGVLPDRVGPHGGPLGAPVGQGRLRGRGPGEVRPARARDAHDAAPRRRPRARARGRRDRPRHHPPGGRGLRPAVRGRHHRRVPGGEPRADGHAAAAAAAHLLRPRHRGRAHPPRPDPGRLGAPVPAPPHRRGAGHVPAPDPRRAAWRRRSACRCSRSSSCRSRSTPRASAPARPTGCARRWARSAHAPAWPRCASGSSRAWPSRGIVGETAEEIAPQARGVRRLRLPREPLGELRLPRVLELVDQAALSRRSSRARCSTRSRWASTHRTRSCATPCATAWRCSGPCIDAVAARLHAGAAQRRRRARRTAEARAGTPSRRRSAVRVGSALRARPVRRTARPHRRRTRGAAVHRPRGLHPPHRAHRSTRSSRSPPRARSRASTSPAATRCGPPARCATRGRSSTGTWSRTRCPAWSPGVEAPPLPGMTDVEETAADLWSLGLSPGRHPTEFVRDRLTARGAVTVDALRTTARPHGGGGGGRGHAPPAARDRARRGVPQPRGRDRPREHHLHRRRVEAVPQGRALVARVVRAGHARTPLRRHQRGGPPHRAARRSATPTSSAPATSADRSRRSRGRYGPPTATS